MSETEEEGELDPAMERVRRKLARLLFVSSGIMVLGLAAVVVGIFYRVGKMEESAKASEPIAIGIAPEDLAAVAASDDRLVLTIRGERPRIEIRRLSDGALKATLLLQDAAPAAPVDGSAD